MRRIVIAGTLLLAAGCCGDRPWFRGDDDRPLLRDRDRDERNMDDGPGRFHWFGPSKDAPKINPPIPNLPPTRDPIPPRAEDPSWRNR